MLPPDPAHLNQLGKLLIDTCQARNKAAVDVLHAIDLASKLVRSKIWRDLSDQGVNHQDIARLFHVTRATVTMALNARTGRNGGKNT